MKKFLTVTVLAWMACGMYVGAQEDGGVISFDRTVKIKPEFVDAPVFAGGAAKPGGTAPTESKWMEVEFKYACMPPEALDLNSKKGIYLDEAQFKIYIEGINPDEPNSDQGEPILLVGEVTYINIPAGKENYGVFYVHPNTIGRYGGQATFEKSNKNIRIEAYINGQLVDVIQKKEEDDDGWINPIKRVNHQVYTKEESPFRLVNISRYPAEKKNRRD
ncbi:MAG: hypothetical protein NZM04_07385 [Methylacidiphilales bacterium]|nr:hypothetical protein [Candidatus Methylacidiphilales bacterium]MDW8349213.1 Amuc_1102 family pilus-like protein [Verrucomicrobiae bacterium]